MGRQVRDCKVERTKSQAEYLGVKGLGFRVKGLGFRVKGLGFRVGNNGKANGNYFSILGLYRE